MTVSAKDQLALMARYHGWATERLLASVEPMPEEAYRRPCGLFFQSVHGTLNHLPRETFVAEAKLAVDLEAQLPGILRKIAVSMGMADDFAKWEASHAA